LLTFFQYQVSQRRIERDRVSAAAEGTVTVKVDMLPSDRRDCLEKDQGIASAGKSPKASLTEFSGVCVALYLNRRLSSEGIHELSAVTVALKS
jgi:hypothetical protein